MSRADSEPARQLHALLQACVEANATDIHLAAGGVARIRVHGHLDAMDDSPAFTADDIDAMVGSVLSDRQAEHLDREWSLDLAYTSPEGHRFRMNAYRERNGMALAVRRLEGAFRTLEGWGLPSSIASLTSLRDGLVLVTGPTGSGKTTTLATLLDMINTQRACHIVTIEDPIEYLHTSRKAMINQREVHTSVPDFAGAVRSALRQDPDVLLVGEMRDLETMRAAITAAETGHLVFSTLHTGDAIGSVERMIGVFPAEEQQSIRQQVSLVLRQVVTQRLLPARNSRHMTPAVESLVVTPAVANLIRTGRTEQIHSVMESGQAVGMRTLEQDLARLVHEKVVTRTTAESAARRPAELEAWLSRATLSEGI